MTEINGCEDSIGFIRFLTAHQTHGQNTVTNGDEITNSQEVARQYWEIELSVRNLLTDTWLGCLGQRDGISCALRSGTDKLSLSAMVRLDCVRSPKPAYRSAD